MDKFQIKPAQNKKFFLPVIEEHLEEPIYDFYDDFGLISSLKEKFRKLNLRALMIDHPKIHELYHYKEIGSGSYGRVYKVRKMDDHSMEPTFYALKYF